MNVGHVILHPHVRVSLGEGGGDLPPPSNEWNGSLNVDMFQEVLKSRLLKSCPRGGSPILWTTIMQ